MPNDGGLKHEIGRLPEDTEAVVSEGEAYRQDAEATLGKNTVEAGRIRDEELGDEAEPEIEELHQIKSQVAEVAQAFETRVERMSSPYVISPELEKTLRVSRILHKPLLLEGEPGTGKTSLAYALAGEEDTPVIHCRGKSTLSAQSIMYEIDYVARLNDASLSQAIPEVMRADAEKWSKYIESGGSADDAGFQSFMNGFERAVKLLNIGKVSDVRNYITYGELGEAITRAASGEKVILLFDEIDKAKRDFPNDLLDELEHMTMRVRETGQEISAPKGNVTVVITSNHERDLPNPFLRRCVYSYIEFPEPYHMTEIVKAHLPNVEENLLDSAISRFYEIRNLEGIQKPPSTSEMLDWINVLIAENVGGIGQTTPYPETLVKTKEDLDLLRMRLGVPEEVISTYEKSGADREAVHAHMGRFVFRLDYNDSYGSLPDEIYLELANRGYSFKTYDSYNSPFEIEEPGYERLGYDTFSVAPPEGLNREALDAWIERSTYLYALLCTKGLVATQFVRTKIEQRFNEVEKATKDFVKGKDENGNALYRFSDGTWIVEKGVKENDAAIITMESSLQNAIEGNKRSQKIFSDGTSCIPKEDIRDNTAMEFAMKEAMREKKRKGRKYRRN